MGLGEAVRRRELDAQDALSDEDDSDDDWLDGGVSSTPAVSKVPVKTAAQVAREEREARERERAEAREAQEGERAERSSTTEKNSNHDVVSAADRASQEREKELERLRSGRGLGDSGTANNEDNGGFIICFKCL